MDPFTSTAWSLGYNLWSVSPGYERAAELALIGRQLYAALTVGISVKLDLDLFIESWLEFGSDYPSSFRPSVHQ